MEVAVEHDGESSLSQKSSLQEISDLVPPSMLYQKLTDHQLLEISKLVDRDFELFAVPFGLDRPDITNIRCNYPEKNELRLYHVLLKWKQKFGDGATLHSLVQIAWEQEWIEFAQSACLIARKIHGQREKVMYEQEEMIKGDIVAVCVLLLMLLYNFWNGHVNGYSRGLPMRVKDSIFGRDQHIQDIINLLSFDREELRIVSITGSPGFGKSTIAMIVGHQLIYQGINVYYVSLNELTSIDDLVRELYSYRLEGGQPTIRDVLDSKDRLSSVKTELSPRHLSKWGETLQENTVLIIDNSDTWLNPEEQKMEFKKVVKFLRDSSMHLKLLVTSRQRFLQLGLDFHLYPRLSKLDEKAAYRVIKSIIPEANMSLCEKISALSGNVPLALQLVSSLLKQKTDEYVMKELRDSLLFDHEDLQDLDSEERINDTIHISVQYLREDLQRAAEYLSLFPGSFTSESACFILKSIFESFTDIYCRNGLEKLVKYSLLEIGDDRFFYHSLLRKFFLQVGNIKDSKTFHISFNKYFIKLLLRILNSPSSDMDAAEIFNLERHNIQQMLSSLIEFGNHHQMIELAYGVHSVIHDKDLYNPFSTNEAIELIGTEISYLVTNCQSMLESSSSEYVRVYVFLVSDLLEMHDGISSYHQLLSRRSDNMSKCIQSISFEDLSHQYNELQFKVVKKIFLLSDLPMK